MTATAEKPKAALPPAGSADDIQKVLTVLRRFEKQLAKFTPDERDWILSSLTLKFAAGL